MTVDGNNDLSFIEAQKTVYVLECKQNTLYEPRSVLQDGVPIVAKKYRHLPMLQLLEGKEDLDNCSVRLDLFKQLWINKQLIIDNILKDRNKQIFKELNDFLVNKKQENEMNKFGKKISSALLTMGTNLSNHSLIYDNLISYLERENQNTNNIFKIVRISPRECSNMKNTLRSIISQILVENEVNDNNEIAEDDEQEEEEEDEDDDDDDEDEDEDMGEVEVNNFLNYDFDAVIDWYHNISTKNVRIVILIEESELFPSSILNLLLNLFKKAGMINVFKLIFCLSSSIELFEENLPLELISMIEGTIFNIDNSKKIINNIADEILFPTNFENNELNLLFGVTIIDQLLNHEQDEIGFVNVLKYSYSIYFFNNPLSILNIIEAEDQLEKEHIECLRMLPSFMRYAESLDKQMAIEYVKDDLKLTQLFKTNFENYQKWVSKFYQILNLFIELQNKFNNDLVIIDKLEIYHNILKYGDFFYNMQFYKELKNCILKNASFDNIASLLLFLKKNDHLNHIYQDVDAKFSSRINSLFNNNNDIDNKRQNNTNNVLSKELESISTEILKMLEIEIRKTLSLFTKDKEDGDEQIVFIEVFIIDIGKNHTQNILTSAFKPPIRSVIDTALSHPRKYLNITNDNNNSNDDDNTDKVYSKLSFAVEPILNELFRLYCEANTFINIYDFYVAFKESLPRSKIIKSLLEMLKNGEFTHDIISEPSELEEMIQFLSDLNKEQDDESTNLKWDKLCLAWFSQGIMELEYLGLVRDAYKKKSESLEKLIWKGL
ncbi:hypothetical protein PACTADRAFT_5216 [Pachysolen tannophilus NRRL Y-2460]|uniref:Uncharacterized protein n=1 Tax=Pachysolen tannophilus NRRL Y-2460 TaxID=669874 RepID=A0A1E4TNY6_PACTA|nr:hypothetical protein PACTADRAFT_5216 [Pachysolen tannophilus NRRL Y-2460]